jgi:hypothetical protein
MSTGVIGTNTNGQPVFANDQCTIMGIVASISGSGSTASCTITTKSNDSIVVQAQDCYAPLAGGPVNPLDSSATNPAVAQGGMEFGTGFQVSVRGVVTGLVSGSGSTALLSIKLANSQNSVNASAGALQSAASVAGNLV